jgi:hypothetical protein
MVAPTGARRLGPIGAVSPQAPNRASDRRAGERVYCSAFMEGPRAYNTESWSSAEPAHPADGEAPGGPVPVPGRYKGGKR